jgi:hypothetical protein
LLHQVVAAKIAEKPALWDDARTLLDRWRRDAGFSGYYADTWTRLMNEGRKACLAVAVEDSERADALRQSSPFSCLLTGQEKIHFRRTWRVWRDAVMAGLSIEDENRLLEILLDPPPLDEEGETQLALEQKIVQDFPSRKADVSRGGNDLNDRISPELGRQADCILRPMPPLYEYKELRSLRANFSVRNGWLPIIAAAVSVAQQLAPEIEITDIREKYGGLRIQAENGNAVSAEAIYTAELFSLFICEITGTRGDLTLANQDILQTLSPSGIAAHQRELHPFPRTFEIQSPGANWPADPPLASARHELDDQSAMALLALRHEASLAGTDVRVTASHFDLADAALATLLAIRHRERLPDSGIPLARLGWFGGRFVVDAGPGVMTGVGAFAARMAPAIDAFGGCRPPF